MKYIDAERLKEWLEKQADIEFKKTEENASSPVLCHFHNGCRMQALDTIDFIDSLQQEQPDFPTTDEEIEMFLATHPKVEVPNKYKTPDWLWKQQEEPEVDLEKIIEQTYHDGSVADTDDIDHVDYENIARHFYELGLNARKED